MVSAAEGEADEGGYQDISLLDTSASYLDVKPRPDGADHSQDQSAAAAGKGYIEVEEDVDATQGYVDVDMDATQGYVDVTTDARDRGYVDVAVEGAHPATEVDAAAALEGLTPEQRGDCVDAVLHKPAADAQHRSEAAEHVVGAEAHEGSEDEAGERVQ